jgi:molecular chaperone DnaK (HSP70)
MRSRVTAIALLIFLLGCQKMTRSRVEVEDSTGIVGANQITIEALGIETARGVFTPLIEAGSKVPCSVTEKFSTSENRQTQITIALFRGKSPTTTGDTALGRYQVVGIPAGPPGATVIEITFSISSRQIWLSARDRANRTDLEVRRVAAESDLGAHSEHWSYLPAQPDPRATDAWRVAATGPGPLGLVR